MQQRISDATLESSLIDYAGAAQALATPRHVLEGLHDAVSGFHKLHVLGAARFPAKFRDWKAVKLGETVFLHATVPKGWWEEYVLLSQEGIDPGLMMARVSLAPYTWSESSATVEPIGVDRWPYELALKYGMRDGLTCPVGGRWVVAYWSPVVLTRALPAASRAALFMGATSAAPRLETLVGPKSYRIGQRARLTPRELAVLRWASLGKQVQETAEGLGLGVETVRSHLKKAQEKLGARNRTHAVAEAMRQQLFS
jgi:DNA-binding CsgD family transcriptional regulator